MDDDQQFCLRWNNHQSTLVSVFDNLLENGTLVDCTLFAEGKFLKAHKVVLSACSPYFESLLTQEYDKHPIFILKDVKFQELKAMMDYMYRGEVNISQDQLAALLKAAESLQIKGLSDSRSKENDTRKAAAAAAAAPPPPPVAAKTPPPAPTLPRVQGLTIEQRKTPKLCANIDVIEESRSRDGSVSPVPRKRKKPRRRTSNSQDGVNDNHDASSSSESHSNPSASAQNIPCTLPAVPLASTSKLTADVPDQLETKTDILTRQIKTQSSSTATTTTTTIPSSLLPQCSVSDSIPQVPIKEKLETHSELILEPKSEYIEEEMNEDSVEDLTLEDDDDVSQMEQEMDHARPGPSHGSTDGSQGFGGWHMSGNQAQDEVFLAAQEAVGAHRDSQVFIKEEPRDEQPELIVNYSKIIENINPDNPSTSGENSELKVRYICSQCGANYSWKSNLVKHIERKHCKSLLKVEPGMIPETEIPIITSMNSQEIKENKKVHKCKKCGSYYSLKNNLLRHLKYHCGIPKQLSCTHCERQFRRSDNLKKHMEICQSVKEKLIASQEKDTSLFYTKIIDSEKKYFCIKCESEYNSRRGVLRHSQLECEVSRKHSCSYCPQNFNRRYLYIAHLKKMHGL